MHSILHYIALIAPPRATNARWTILRSRQPPQAPAGAAARSKVRLTYHFDSLQAPIYLYLVEYTDPSGVYPLIASDLQSRLPLRTLNWNSPSRPVRSIESLYVELVPDEKNSSQPQKRAASSAGLPGQDTSSTSVVSDGRRGSESQAPKRERRHQIPGLRQTPYLKIYLLRCDDPDSYKAVARKAVREWIKAQAISQSNASTSNQENHDAFEWLIIHVVLPDPQGNSIWPTKLSATVLDKLRSDFNSSSKSSNDRVVQIPATKNLQVQGVTVSGTPSGPAREPFLQESGRAWDDLVAKFKSLILASFDSRVRQYEEDIKEKGSQRSLPGWNFCTFFVLKEGLARGFESVGLVDDALMGYDELSFELLAALRDQINKAAAGEDAGLFRDHTEDLRFQAEEALATTDASAENPGKYHLSTSVLDTERKPYRELILASNISAFDFRSYVFARQVSILSRIASLSAGSNPPPLKVSTNSNASGTVDPLVLTEICQRAVNFIASIGRTLRKDLQSAIPVDAEATESERAARFNVIENIISSWTYTSAQQILARTTEPSLSHEVDTFPVLGSHPNSPLSPSSGSRYSGQTPLPPRSSSLFGRIAPGSPSQQIDNASDDGRALKSPPPNPLSAGALQLAAQRGQLNLVARNALGAIGARRGWANGWKVIAHQETQEEMDDISLDGDLSIRETKKEKRPQNNMNDALPGVFDNSLRSALSSEENFYSAYEVSRQ